MYFVYIHILHPIYANILVRMSSYFANKVLPIYLYLLLSIRTASFTPRGLHLATEQTTVCVKAGADPCHDRILCRSAELKQSIDELVQLLVQQLQYLNIQRTHTKHRWCCRFHEVLFLQDVHKILLKLMAF